MSQSCPAEDTSTLFRVTEGPKGPLVMGNLTLDICHVRNEN